jgi:L-ascorbate metabolism protein UlaG (beta-lactamase superfamily)
MRPGDQDYFIARFEQEQDMLNREPLYLRKNIQVEPLVDHWYAWPYLIPPATYARNMCGRHFKIMDSYIAAPQVHAEAVKNPRMLGGPFIDYENKVDEIKALRDQTKQDRKDLVEFSSAIDQLDSMLRGKAKGLWMHPLYEEIPAGLRGYIELVYDLNNNPSFRLLEPLLYKSEYYHREAQSLMLSPIQNDDRPFVLSTPRLESPNSFHFKIPFADPAIDELFRLKFSPKPMSRIRDMVDVPASSEALFNSFFTPEPPRPYKPYTGKGIRWRYFGHACILVETGGVSMLFDPVLSYTYESKISRYTYLDLPQTIDYVLITHNHQDHVLFETLLQLRHKIRHVVVPRGGGGPLQDPSLKLLLQNCGFPSVIELQELETLPSDGMRITGVPFMGEHCDLDIRTKLAYLVRTSRNSLLFAADSCNIEPVVYKHIHDDVGDLNALFLGMECDGAPLSWLYGPLLSRPLERDMDQSRRLYGSNFDQALDMVKRFRCREVYVYAMGQEPWLNYVMSLKYTAESRPIIESNKLLDYCKAHGIVAERLFGEKEILIESIAASSVA